MDLSLRSQVEVPGLPDDLRWIPEAPDSGDDPLGEQKRQAFSEWTNRLSQLRIQRKIELQKNPEQIMFERERCRRSSAYFLCMWGWIFEQRNDEDGEGGGPKPWLMFPAQIEMLHWLDARLMSRGHERDGIVSKARDMGASWTCCGWALHGWLFKSPWTILFLSRKEDLVESKKSDSLFWKIKFLLRRIDKHAPWMMPEGFEFANKQHMSHMAIINPVTGSELIGESTNANAGRGARATAVLIDEAAFVPDLMDIWNGLTASTNVRIGISSESLQQGPGFYQLGMGNKNTRKPALFELNWWENPYHDAEWLEMEKGRYENRIEDFYKEILRDARAGSSNWVYPSAEDKVTEDIDYEPNSPLFVTIDPGMRDETALVWVQIQGGDHVVLASYQNSAKPAEFYGTIITGIPDHDNEWTYNDRDYEIMSWTKTLPMATFYGDNYGSNQMGASTESFYAVLKRKFKIHVNADHTSDGDAVGYMKEVRYDRGRREAVREMLPSMRFANKRQAGFVLKCLQENQFATQSGTSVSEQRSPIHDWTSHMCQAIGFYAAHRKMRISVSGMNQWRKAKKKRQNSRDLRVTDPNYRDYGRISKRGIASPDKMLANRLRMGDAD